MDEIKISKYISLILRHKPETIGIKLDKHGYAKVNELIAGIRKKYPEFNIDILKHIVETDEKQRYSFKDHYKLIRANQGHSILSVDLELKPQQPPQLLFHGTSDKYLNSIINEGLIPKSRQYVHLSTDIDTAHLIGLRHGGKTVLFIIDTHRMYKDGYKFYLSENNVWLTDKVPKEYFCYYFINSDFDLELLKVSIGEHGNAFVFREYKEGQS